MNIQPTDEEMHAIEHAVSRFGGALAEDTLCEELAEMIVAVKHMRRGRAPLMEVVDEMADVMVCFHEVMISRVGHVGNVWLADAFERAIRTKVLPKIKSGDYNHGRKTDGT